MNPRVRAWTERAANLLVSQHREALSSKRKNAENNLGETEKATNPEPLEETKPTDCDKFLGYLYLKKAPSETRIPSECYNCPKLLQCLYSPRIIEKVYGE